MKLIIHATNIHTGGGAILLRELIASMPSENELLVFVDQRFVLPECLPKNIAIVSVAPTVANRLNAEYMLYKVSNGNTIVVCFGNLPPLFKLKSSVILFLQNRHLVDDQYLNRFPIKTRIKIFIEKLWFKLRASNINIYMVQTQSMRAALENIEWAKDSKIMVAPFISFKKDFQALNSDIYKKYDFLYVASGHPHKNHENLILAWCILAQKMLFPSLCLTIDGRLYPNLLLFINKKKSEFGLRIENVGNVPHQNISRLYSNAKALIYPSLSESFGMPLIEAQKFNMPILASELDFVRDNVDPAQSFNPSSPVSIARAVNRYLSTSDVRQKIYDPKEFIEKTFGLANGKML